MVINTVSQYPYDRGEIQEHGSMIVQFIDESVLITSAFSWVKLEHNLSLVMFILPTDHQ